VAAIRIWKVQLNLNKTEILFSVCAGSSMQSPQELLLFGQRQRGKARHSGAPMLRRYAATSALLLAMAHLIAVPPTLQGR
jgi:hypothetical protein